MAELDTHLQQLLENHATEIIFSDWHQISADEEGLESQDYGGSTIEQLWKSTQPADLARLEAMLTVAYIGYVSDISPHRGMHWVY